MYIPSEWPGEKLTPLSGYEPARQMLFASVFPVDTNELELLFTVMDKLRLNDSSISVSRDLSLSLGAGLRCGFLGFLHMEVVIQRLRDEFGMSVVMTTPSVPYIIEYTGDEVKRVEISSVADCKLISFSFPIKLLGIILFGLQIRA